MQKKYLNTFSGIYFLGHRDNSEYEKAKIVILPASYEGTCSLGLGTKNAPEAILEASYFTEPFDEESLFSLDKTGMHTLKIQKYPDSKPAKSVVSAVQDITSQILKDKKFPVMIGGEHSLTIGTVKAVQEHTTNLSMLQIDAHTDLDALYKDERYHHATMARELKDSTGIKITQVGIRSCIKEHLDYAKQENIPIFFAHNIINCKHTIQEIIQTLTNNVYLTIDVDAFDPSVFPHTGTPEPNGLKWQYIINLIKAVAKTKNIVGLDIVEHASKNPKKPHYSDYNASKLLHKVLCIIWKEKTTKNSGSP